VYSTAKNKRLIGKSRGTIFDGSAYKVLLYSTVHDIFISNIGIRPIVIVLVFYKLCVFYFSLKHSNCVSAICGGAPPHQRTLSVVQWQ